MADPPKKTNANPSHASNNLNTSNSGENAGRKKATVITAAPQAADAGDVSVRGISCRFAIKKMMQRKRIAQGYIPLKVRYSGDRLESDLKGNNITARMIAGKININIRCLGLFMNSKSSLFSLEHSFF